jgi:diaminopimelate epimerase
MERWHALGNVYLVTRAELTADDVRALVGDADGIVQVLASGHDWADVVIWNPDGSTAEMSGNATRIAARWLADATGSSTVVVRVGEREVRTRMLPGCDVEQELGEVEVGPTEEIDGVRVTPVSVGNPHAVVVGDPAEIVRIGPLLETHPRFPQRTNVQVVRVDGEGVVTARVWERGVGETSASGTSAVAVAAATHGSGRVVVRFPGGDLTVELAGGRATLTGPAERVE